MMGKYFTATTCPLPDQHIMVSPEASVVWPCISPSHTTDHLQKALGLRRRALSCKKYLPVRLFLFLLFTSLHFSTFGFLAMGSTYPCLHPR